MSYRQFTAKLRADGWRSIGQGTYAHEETGQHINCWDAVRGIEIWRWYAERGELPNPERTQMERHAMIRDEEVG